MLAIDVMEDTGSRKHKGIIAQMLAEVGHTLQLTSCDVVMQPAVPVSFQSLAFTLRPAVLQPYPPPHSGSHLTGTLPAAVRWAKSLSEPFFSVWAAAVLPPCRSGSKRLFGGCTWATSCGLPKSELRHSLDAWNCRPAVS